MAAKERAKSLLVHYFKVVWPFDQPFWEDNKAEIRNIVEYIIEAAVEACKEELRKEKEA